MSLNATPTGSRVHIGLFGRRNAGKSSVINAVTGQDLAIVSEVKGTTTDPVYKSMELLPLGPVVLIDTPGLDDEGRLGGQRVKKALQVLNKSDLALLVVDGVQGLQPEDEEILKKFHERNLPYLLVFNKLDEARAQCPERLAPDARRPDALWVSAATGENIDALRRRVADLAPPEEDRFKIVSDLLAPGDTVVLVVPIDSAAPKGRLILPQQQTIRDILEADGVSLVVKESGLREALASLKAPPRLVITDSQAFGEVAKIVPRDIPLTSFSILMARNRGNLEHAVRAVRAVETLEDGDTVLIAEGCTHHRQCGDIGTEKLPAWIREFTGKEPEFVFTSGTEFPEDLSGFHLIIHCGGCMLNEREMKYRLRMAVDQNIPMTNYGVAIAYMTGILERSVRPFITLIS